jgi:cytochrome c2
MYFSSIEKLKDYIKDIEMKPSGQLMIFAADKSASEIDEVIEYLNEKEVKFFRGLYYYCFG